MNTNTINSQFLSFIDNNTCKAVFQESLNKDLQVVGWEVIGAYLLKLQLAVLSDGMIMAIGTFLVDVTGDNEDLKDNILLFISDQKQG